MAPDAEALQVIWVVFLWCDASASWKHGLSCQSSAKSCFLMSCPLYCAHVSDTMHISISCLSVFPLGPCPVVAYIA